MGMLSMYAKVCAVDITSYFISPAHFQCIHPYIRRGYYSIRLSNRAFSGPQQRTGRSRYSRFLLEKSYKQRAYGFRKAGNRAPLFLFFSKQNCPHRSLANHSLYPPLGNTQLQTNKQKTNEKNFFNSDAAAPMPLREFERADGDCPYGYIG